MIRDHLVVNISMTVFWLSEVLFQFLKFYFSTKDTESFCLLWKPPPWNQVISGWSYRYRRLQCLSLFWASVFFSIKSLYSNRDLSCQKQPSSCLPSSVCLLSFVQHISCSLQFWPLSLLHNGSLGPISAGFSAWKWLPSVVPLGGMTSLKVSSDHIHHVLVDVAFSAPWWTFHALYPKPHTAFHCWEHCNCKWEGVLPNNLPILKDAVCRLGWGLPHKYYTDQMLSEETGYLWFCFFYGGV